MAALYAFRNFRLPGQLGMTVIQRNQIYVILGDESILIRPYIYMARHMYVCTGHNAWLSMHTYERWDKVLLG